MSIEALAWAIKASLGKGLTGNAKLVLWQLADHHNKDLGAFLEQQTMADGAEISRATVNRCLDDLVTAHLISRERRVDPATGQQKSSRYRLAFEKDFTPQDVVSRVSELDTAPDANPAEQPGGQPVENSAARVSNSGGAVSHSSETLTFLEPIESPLPPSDGPSFSVLCEKWDSDKLGDLQRAGSTWDRMSSEDRQAAINQVDVTRTVFYSLKRPLPQLRSYLHQRAWEECIAAPLIVEGRFKVVKDTPEWERWLAHYRKASAAVFTGMKRQGFLLVETRWPPGSTTYRSTED